MGRRFAFLPTVALPLWWGFAILPFVPPNTNRYPLSILTPTIAHLDVNLVMVCHHDRLRLRLPGRHLQCTLSGIPVERYGSISAGTVVDAAIKVIRARPIALDVDVDRRRTARRIGDFSKRIIETLSLEDPPDNLVHTAANATELELGLIRWKTNVPIFS